MRSLLRKLLIVLGTLIFIELASFFVHTAWDLVKGRTIEEIITKRKKELGLDKQILVGYGQFEPIGGRWMEVGESLGTGDFSVKKNGFPYNHETVDEATFPRKSPGTVRGLVLGGSSALGLGTASYSETISARLQHYLRHHASPTSETRIEVLNLGFVSGYSGDTLRKFTNYLIYFDPDFIVWYTGFNDAVLEPYARFVNWGPGSTEALSNLRSNFQRTLPHVFFLPFTSAVVKRIESKIRFWRNAGVEDELLAQFAVLTPIPRLATEAIKLRTKNPQRSVFFTNLRMMASICDSFDIALVVFLQPNAFWPTPAEGFKGDNPIIRENYSRFVPEILELESIYSHNSRIRFLDLTNAFESVPLKTVYNKDGFHLTSKGNDVISATMLHEVAGVLQR